MKYQRFVSLSAGLSFVILFLSSGVLYFIPNRSVTGWSGWHFLGLDKQQWDNLHINLGIFFLVMMIWHIYYNWKAIKNYLKFKKKLKIFTKEFNVALVWVSIFTVGTLTMTIPLSILVNLGNGIKAKNAKTMGTPPFQYAEYTPLEDFCHLSHIDPTQALQQLHNKGIKLSSSLALIKDIAAQNHTTPQEIFKIIKTPQTRYPLPSDIPVGIAHKSIEELAQVYQIDLEKFQQHLQKYGMHITPNQRFKHIAKTYHLHPATLYNMLLASQCH